MANRHMKRCSISLIIREIQIKTTVRYHLTLVRKVIIKKSVNKNAEEGVGKRKPSYTAGRIASRCSHYGEQYGDFLKN